MSGSAVSSGLGPRERPAERAFPARLAYQNIRVRIGGDSPGRLVGHPSTHSPDVRIASCREGNGVASDRGLGVRVAAVISCRPASLAPGPAEFLSGHRIGRVDGPEERAGDAFHTLGSDKILGVKPRWRATSRRKACVRRSHAPGKSTPGGGIEFVVVAARRTRRRIAARLYRLMAAMRSTGGVAPGRFPPSRVPARPGPWPAPVNDLVAPGSAVPATALVLSG